MHQAKFSFDTPLSPLELATAWTVLLKDYVGSPDVSFFFTDSTGKSGQPTRQRVDLLLHERETLGQLSCQIEEQLAFNDGIKATAELSPFKTHVYISSAYSEISVSGDKLTETVALEAGNCNSRASEIDLEIKCMIPVQGEDIYLSTFPKSAACSSIKASRILKQFQQVLHKVHAVASASELVYKIETASESDIRQIWEWNRHMAEAPKTTALEIFSDWVKRQPEALAVDAWDGSLTYKDLDTLSTKLSSKLSRAAVRKGNIVPLCFEKSMWTPVAILAVIKTGAAFVLLSEDLPVERLRHVAEILAQEIVLALASSTQLQRARHLASKVLTIDSHLLEDERTRYPRPAGTFVEPSDLINIVFTSGTTGMAKAAMLRHSNVCAFAAMLGPLRGMTNSSRLLAWASYAFDVSLGDTWASLLSGACLCVPSSWECKNDVARIVFSYRATHVMITPQVSKMITPSDVPNLQVLDLTGEPCTEDTLARWRGSRTRITNVYGPAECSCNSVAHDDILNAPTPSTIGNGFYPCWIMDPMESNRLSPIGAIGELVLEGPLVGDGYLHNEKATAAAFSEDPEWLLKGCESVSQGRRGRLYRTGDLVRYLDDGQLDIIGRRDYQAKVRGQRIELGELATHLHKLIPESIKWCPEVANLKSGSELLLVFLVPPLTEAESTNDILRKLVNRVDLNLKRALPTALVPGAYACIKEIPLAVTGKTDRRRLKKIASSLETDQLIIPEKAVSFFVSGNQENGLPQAHTNGSSLRSQADAIGHGSNINTNKHNSNVQANRPTQRHTNGYSTGSGGRPESKLEMLKTLWGEVLHVDPGSIRQSDTFFSLGGESLKAIRLTGAAARTGLQIDVPTIFKYPRLSDLASKSRLSFASDQVLLKPFSLLKNDAVLSQLAEACETSVADIEDAYPCTPMQEGLITAEGQRAVSYTGRAILPLPKHVDAKRLVWSWQRVADHHSILRTRIVDTESDGLIQVVLKDGKLSTGRETRSLATYLEEDNNQKMGLGTVLCRYAIVREPASAYLVLTMHHAIYDGWTVNRIGAEVFRAYQGVRIYPFLGFNAFIKHLMLQDLKPAQEYWARQLSEPGRTAFFPAVPISIQEPKADSVISKSFSVPTNTNHDITMPSLLRAAWALIVAKLSGSDDVTFGMTVSGRNVTISGIEDLLSPTITTIPVRARIAEGETLGVFLAKIQQEALEAMPFENIGLQTIGKTNLDTREGCKFQTLLIVQPSDPASSEPLHDASRAERDLKSMLENLDESLSVSLSDFNEYALMVSVTQKEENLLVQASYDSRILHIPQVDLLLDQYMHVAQQVGLYENSARSPRTLDFASDSDLEIIWRWNSAPVKGERKCIHDIIGRVAVDQPSALAICAWDGNFSYEKLDKLSGLLARILCDRGIGRGNIVPICMEKSKWATIAMLGILRSGAAFLSMDVRQQPKERLRTMIGEVKADWVVAAGPATALAHEVSPGVINCDELDQDESSGTQSLPAVSPSDLAFVVFTSGSTGIPKGIFITHENFCSTIPHHQRELKLTKDTRIYDYASYSFDIAVHNALMATTVGGCLCVPSEDDRDNDIEGSFERLEANWADITSSVARLIDPEAVTGLKTLVLSGEVVGKDVIKSYADRVEIINAYGPAETQICTIQQKLQVPEDAAKIGHGIGCSTWIVDPDSDTLSPIGAIGELVIEGPIVSPGYLNAPHDAFIKDPTWLLKGSPSISGRRGNLYRTGDLACYEPNGTILYKGRATTQTKINGQRVELGEIEFHILCVLPTLRDVIVDVISLDGLNLICAFLLPRQSALTKGTNASIELVTSPNGLQDRLRGILPVYMIPTIFFSVSHIPLTPTRKADRRKLKESAAHFSRDEIVPLNLKEPILEEREMNEQQRSMMRAWSQVLKLESSKIRWSSDFFNLGGDSISAMRLVKVARKQGLSFALWDIFQHSRFEDLCGVAGQCKKENEENTKSDQRFDTVRPYALVPAKDRNALIASAATSCNISPEEIIDIYPCTPFQEAVFAQTVGDPSVYVQHTELKFIGDLDIGQVLAAWESVIASTPILRTRIVQSEYASLVQVVIREVPEWQRYESAEAYLIDSAKQPMWPGNKLCRFGLVRSGSELAPENKIIWTIHHAIYDSWTIRLVLRQVSEAYHGRVNSELGPNYNVLVRFLRDQETKSKDWWRSTLIGASDAAVFPKAAMTSRSTITTTSCTKRKDIELSDSMPSGYTTAVLLRSAWAVVMARHTGGESVLFGEMRLGRNIPIKEVQTMRGPTIAAVPVLIHIDREQSAKTLLDHVRDTTTRVQDFDHFGLQNISRINEDTKAACKFQTFLVIQDNEEKSNASNSIFKVYNTIDDIRNFNSWNLMIIFNRNSRGLVAEALFEESVISAEQVDVLLDQTQSILRGICALPTSALLTELDKAKEEDINKIWKWNASVPETIDDFVHSLVSKQARRAPDHIAVIAHDGQMTYGELDEYSSNLAAQLLARGVGVSWLVPLCFEKSLWVPVAMLGVIKTGAAFSVMDVSYPVERLKTISKLMEARIILASPAQRELAERLVDNVFEFDKVTCATTCQGNLVQVPSLDTNRTMYVCFTSGSTGIPKGVVVSHRNLASATIHQTRDLGFGSDDRVYDFSSHAFDANIWHTWLALVAGSVLCIPSEEDRLSNLAGSITSFRTTKLFLTPSVARTIDPRDIPTVQRLWLGGEAVTPLDVSMWREHLDLWCAYGPTEITPLCIFTPLLRPESASNIGKGSGVNPWICNPNNYNELVAVGAVGEMVMEGPLVTKGYHGEPEKTAKVFIKDPEFLTRGTGTRHGRHGNFYRTGDLVRYAPNGSIEYFGRVDEQVKLRGQRVEFGEIEYHLKNAQVEASAIVCEVVKNPSERPALVAFCATSSTKQALDKAKARTYLSKRLPPYMIPEAFLEIPEIPKAPSGKINRLQLRKLGPGLLQLSAASERDSLLGQINGPLTKMETTLQSLWARALSQPVRELCPDSDFFDLGADSIATMKLSNLAREYAISLTMNNIMQNPKLSQMAISVQPLQSSWKSPRPFSLVDPSQSGRILAKAAAICRVPLESITDIYPCTPLQTELFALTMKQPQAYVKRSVFEVPGHINIDKLFEAWKAVINLNAVLRTRFVDIEGLGLLQVVLREQKWEAFDSLDAHLANPTKADLGSPLSQIAIGAEESPKKIVWTIHHALYDGWSVSLIEDQLRKAYQDQLILRPPEFSGFVRHLLSQDPQQAKDFWQHRLAGCRSVVIYPRMPSRSYQVQPSQTFKRILHTASASGTSLQTTIHAAWALIVSKLSETDDVVFAATLAGRNASIPGIEQMVGPTITPVPIRIRLGDSEKAVSELLSNIERDTISMGPFQHIGTKNIETMNCDTREACKFQTLIVMNPPDSKAQESDVIRTSTYEVKSEDQGVFHTFALVLFFTPTQDGFALEIVYDPVLLARREIERLSGRLESVISDVSRWRSNDLRISDVECLGKEDLQDIWGWNSMLPPANERLLHDIILDRAQHLKADKIAIDAWDCKICYSQLDKFSDNLSRSLCKHGIGRGSVVPILSSKSGYVPIAALAVLRTGATILPLDASQPANRLRKIVEQAHADVILATEPSIEVAITLEATVVPIGECLVVQADDADSLPDNNKLTQPDDVACILFTSGSTGTPKGVMQTHRALSSAVANQAAESGFNEKTRAFEFASYAFDVSWNMIFKALAIGATLCVPSEDERKNDLVGALNRSAATLTELTASVARLINPKQLSTLNTLILSGEFIDQRDFEHWKPRVHIVICYGPSECTSVSTINAGQTVNSRNDGIGKGSSCVIWLVDPRNHRRLMPVGAIGEILIEGPNVGNGYFNDKALTSASYVSDLPWLNSQENRYGRICFKSGDLARYDLNGNLHFVSRKDSQIKLHGQRIELEEVQYHVRKTMGNHVGSVVCSALGEGNNQMLAAFLRPGNAETTDHCALLEPATEAVTRLQRMNENLRAILPSYMIPAVYYFVSIIPRTANGKLERKKLVEIAEQALPGQVYRGRPDRKVIRRAPTTQAEIEMQRLWATTLDASIESIGADDDFFDLYGDSITAMRLVAAARSKGYDLRVSDVFASPRLSELALKIQSKTAKEQIVEIDKPFAMLGDSVDVAALRMEVAAKCSIQDMSTIEDIYPCSPLQESMIGATIKDSRAFISMRLYRIHHGTDLGRLQAAWAHVVARNRILRTRLVDIKGYGLNQVVIQGHFLWDTYYNLQLFLEKAWKEKMGLGSRLARWALIKEPEEWRLVWIIHHTTYDGWIVPLIVDEVQKTYLGQALPAPPPDMRKFVKYLSELEKESSVAFWDQELKYGNEAAVFPLLPSHNFQPDPRGYLEKQISAEFSSLPSGFNLTAILYGSWSLLMSRLTGNQKQAFGAILTGRNAPVDNINKVMSPTITTVPIMVDVNSSLSVSEFLMGFREMTRRMIPHEHLGIHAIRRINAASAAACNFQTVLVIQPPMETDPTHHQPGEQHVMEELDETKVEGFPNQHAVLNQYGLMMEILPIDNATTVKASFDSKLISTSQIARIISQWEQILQQLLQTVSVAPSTLLRSLGQLCQQDLDDIWAWNKHVPETFNKKFVHQNISEIASQYSDAVAIDSWDGQLTYGELEKLSSRLADSLAASGIKPGCFVPILFHKSMWANVSMLAVLKSGGAFVPFDAKHPEGRLRFLMQPLKADIILCSAETRDLGARLAPRAMLVDASLKHDADTGNGYDREIIVEVVDNQRSLQATDFAYAVFTSGSTGIAKGVKITHTNLATAIYHQAGAEGFQVNSKTRSLDSSSYSFDACVFNFFYTATHGGCLCIPNDNLLKGDIGAFMSQYKVNWAQLVPSVARTLKPELLLDLRSLILTGEPLTKGDIDTWSRRVRLLNVYGPTECTILCAISSPIAEPSQAGNIGQGRGSNLWLTEIGNPNKLAPVGAVGEILIEGPIIGAGYLGSHQSPIVVDPRFLVAGSTHIPGRRGTLFQTGDKARYTDDGSLIFLGRIGSEVKLRGQRVDLIEVEDIVRCHGPIGMDIVGDIVHIDGGNKAHARQMLVLFVSDRNSTYIQDDLKDKLRIWGRDLKKALEASLPSYSQPEAFVPLPNIPKTSSGKTDYRRLKEIGKQLRLQQLVWISSNVAKASSTPPSTQEEHILASLWAQVLGIDSYSIANEDDFFLLGGDSLGVMRLTTAAQERGVLLKASDVFGNPKLSQLAPKLSGLATTGLKVADYKPCCLVTDIPDLDAFIKNFVAPTLKVDVDQIEDILPANGFQVEYMRNEEEPLGLQYAYLDISSKISWPKLVEATRAVAQSFQCLRARFVYKDGNYYQAVTRDAPLTMEEISTKEQMTTFCNRFCSVDCRQAEVSDVFTKLSLVDAAYGKRRVILRMSHLQNDGWSQIRILHSIAIVYNDGLIEKTPDWTLLLLYREQWREESRNYWRLMLNGTTQTTPSLIFKPGGSKIRTLRTFALPNFHILSDNRRTRPTVVVNVAWALVLQQLAGHDEIVVGNVTTGRNGAMRGLDSVIGPCVNMLPMRLRVGPNSTNRSRKQQLRDLIEASARQVDERTAYEGLDWDDMVEKSTSWPSGTRYTSAVHFRNMAFYPELRLGEDSLTVGWYELVARPHWTTVLVYPEDGVLRLWLLADSAEIGDDGADDILHMLADYVDEITIALNEEVA